MPLSDLKSPLVKDIRYRHIADYNALAARLGWMPSYPQFNRNSLTVAEEARQSGAQTADAVAKYVVNELKEGKLKFAVEETSSPQNFPRVLFVWRANLIGSSAKGHEYFLKHLLGTHHGNLSQPSSGLKTTEVNWEQHIPEGKLDLLVDIDFRMCGTGMYADILMPTATWYEKYDISSTDMHPFIHPFNPAITPPWQARPDWDIFKGLAKTFSAMAEKHFPQPVRDVVATALLHDAPDEISQPFGEVRDWKTGDIDPVPGVSLPNLHLVERDYRKVYEKMIALGPRIQEAIGSKGIAWKATEEYEKLKRLLGLAGSGDYADCPSIFTDRDVAEAILTLSSASNGSMAMKAWSVLEQKTGQKLKDLAEERAEEHMSLAQFTAQPRQVLSTPLFSGTETGNRRYSPFTTNVERLIPWRTLTGRQHFYLDHEIIFEYGEALPLYRPPLPLMPFYHVDERPAAAGKELVLRYLTPHFKWSYHSTYGDTLPMLTLFRGGPHIWLNIDDAKEAGIADNDWVELFNRNGVVAARAVVSHRLPRGIVFMYHVQDRVINMPGTKITQDRSGTFNSPTRILMKPTHMIGGYAQLSYGFNYYGPTGNQRDTSVIVRPLKEVSWLES